MQVEDETVSSASKLSNIFKVTFLEAVNKFLLDGNLMHLQLLIRQNDSVVLLETRGTQLNE
jgi:hypothetical protein